MKLEPRYLGDGVYVTDLAQEGIMLTTGNHDPNEADSIIMLEPEVVIFLVKYLEAIVANAPKRSQG